MEVQSAGRDPNGRFTTGNPGGPGRPRREQEQAILEAITNAIPPVQIGEALRTALDIAIETRSARGIVAVLELQAAYGIGRPTIRVEKPEGDPISAALAEIRRIHQEKLQTQADMLGSEG